MLNLHAVATRQEGRICVFVGGQLPTPCDVAEIIDKYPGGQRVYLVDPGAAQVFISEKRVRTGPCADHVLPWQGSVEILDEAHKKVEIFINEEKKLTVAVQESKEFDVYRVLVQPLNQLLIIPDGQIVPAIYQKVFGPASYKACDDYVKQHAKAA
jgi:hypothetical protein